MGTIGRYNSVQWPSHSAVFVWIVVSHYVPCGFDCDRGLLPEPLPLTPPLLLSVNLPPARLRHACTLGGLLLLHAGLLPRAEGHTEKNREKHVHYNNNISTSLVHGQGHETDDTDYDKNTRLHVSVDNILFSPLDARSYRGGRKWGVRDDEWHVLNTKQN